VSSGRYWIAVISLILTVIGAINWGLVGLFGVDVVAALFEGADTPGARFVYILVGLAGITLLVVTPLWSVGRDYRLPSSPMRS